MSKRVKLEKSVATPQEDEYADWAKKLFSKPTGAQGGNGNQQNLAPIFQQQTPIADLVPPNFGFDRDSAIGTFCWSTISEDKFVPSILRNKELYVCVKMAEESILADKLNVLPPELYDSAKIECYPVTPSEAKLLTYINSWHCDGFYGPDPFTAQKDFVISLKNLETFYNFLNFAFCVLHSGGNNVDPEYKRCGFVRVNGESLIPYAVLEEEEHGVPLFYFEGQTDILAIKAKPLAGWALAYLKVCCKVQGVRKDLIANSTLQIVTLTDLKAYFPKRTTFADKCWPNPKLKSLLPKQVLNSVIVQPPKILVTHDKWSKLEANETFPNYAPTAGAITTNSTTVSTTQLVMNPKNGISNVTLNYNGIPTNYQIPKNVQTRSPALTKIKISTPPIDRSKLIQIQDQPGDKQPSAFVVRLIIVEGQFMHCINANAGRPDEYLVLLQEFMSHFFASCSVYPTGVSLLCSKGIKIFLPNRSQMEALNKFGFQIQESWQMPLVPAIEAQNALPKLRMAVQPRQQPTVAPTVATNRVTNGGNSNYHRAYIRR